MFGYQSTFSIYSGPTEIQIRSNFVRSLSSVRKESTTKNNSTIYACTGDDTLEEMSFIDRVKKAGKTLVDSGAKTMLRVSNSRHCEEVVDESCAWLW